MSQELKPGDSYEIDETKPEWEQFQKTHNLLVECLEVNAVPLHIAVSCMLKIAALAYKDIPKKKFLKNCSDMWDMVYEKS